MLTHQEAETLISARQDAPLSSILEQELQNHLQTCDQCRAFAVATERLTAGLRAMPMAPASPRVRREVMERARGGRSPLAGLFGGWNLQAGPALASLAAVVLIGLLGWFALDRLVLTDSPDNDRQQLSAAPTVPVNLALHATATETPSPTDVPATNTPEPTATTAPPTVVPTETPVPTDVPATETPVPTDPPATDVPVETNAPETVTPEPTTEEPVDLTGTEEAVATETSVAKETVEATEPPAEPTATTAPTEVAAEPTATAEPIPPTATNAPVEPTATEEPTEQAGLIEPVDGTHAAVDSESETPTEEANDATTEETPAIEGTVMSDESTEQPIIEDVSGTDAAATSESQIEPVGTPQDGAAMTGMGGEDTEQLDTSGSETSSLSEASERYQVIAGDPSGMLGLTPEGRLEFMNVPDSASMTTWEGYRLQISDSQPGVLVLCGEEFCEPSGTEPEAEDWQGDTPLGFMQGNVYYLRHYADRTEVYAAETSGTSVYNDRLLGEFGKVNPPPYVWESDGMLFTWFDNGTWAEITPSNVTVLNGSYPNPSVIRFAPMADPPLIGYFSGQTLVIAPVSAPDQPVLAIVTDGVDFDMSPTADRIAVIQNGNIVIMDMRGNVQHVYESNKLRPGSLIWLNSGIVYVDRTDGSLYQIPETAIP